MFKVLKGLVNPKLTAFSLGFQEASISYRAFQGSLGTLLRAVDRSEVRGLRFRDGVQPEALNPKPQTLNSKTLKP